MLRGTNNRERLTGAQGVVRALVGGEATSLVATHDLLLADLADEDGRIRNAHFRESVEGDQLAFDYQIREGPCPTTNALIIMQKAGLPVDAPAEHA
ncbi:MAG: DNA mismatch repair protein MutS, partial [Bacteroidota bacterium]